MFINILKAAEYVKFDWNFILPFELITIFILFSTISITLIQPVNAIKLLITPKVNV